MVQWNSQPFSCRSNPMGEIIAMNMRAIQMKKTGHTIAHRFSTAKFRFIADIIFQKMKQSTRLIMIELYSTIKDRIQPVTVDGFGAVWNNNRYNY